MESRRLEIWAMACWGLCWVVYFAQFFGPDEVLATPLFYVALLSSQVFPFVVAVAIATSPKHYAAVDPPPPPLPPMPACYVAFLKGLAFLALHVPLFVNVGSLLVGKHTVLTPYYMTTLNIVGYLLIGLTKETSESYYGFLVCFLTGVAWSSYKGVTPHGEHALYKVFVCVLSVAIVFLCGTYSQPSLPNADAAKDNATSPQGVRNSSHEAQPLLLSRREGAHDVV